MYRNFVALACASVLAACASLGGGSSGSSNVLNSGDTSGIGDGDQPLIDDTSGSGDSDTTTDDDPDSAYGTDHNDSLTMNNMSFDPDTGELVLNNMPFDGDDNLYARDAVGTAALAGTGSGFETYRNTSGFSDYYAVFRLSDNGYSQVSAAATDRYISFGFGGVAAQRLDGDGSLPEGDESYLFTGEYAAVRSTIDPTTGNQVQYVAGTAIMEVDIEDFDNIGAVEGLIVNRRFFDVNGIEFTELEEADFISLATAQINFDDWTIESSTAGTYRSGEADASGTWEGFFAGPNGEEIAGIVFVQGQGVIGVDPDTGSYDTVEIREIGGFVATR